MRLCITGIAKALRVPLVHHKGSGWGSGYVPIGEGDRDGAAQACLVDQEGKLRRVVVCYRKTLEESAEEVLHELAHLALPGSFENEDMLVIWMAEASKRLRGRIAKKCKHEMEFYGYPWKDPQAEEPRFGSIENFERWVRSDEYKKGFAEAIRAGVLRPDGTPRLKPVQ